MSQPLTQGAATEQQWYVLQLAPNQERTAAAWLNPSQRDIERARTISDKLGNYIAQRAFGLYVPLKKEKTTRGIRRQKIVVTRPLFPGYGFVPINFSVDGARLNALENAPGVIGFVQFAEQLATISAKAMARIRSTESAALIPRTKASAFAVGEQVLLNEGPLCGFPATIETLDDSDRVGILVHIFGTKTRVSVDCDCIGKP
jgi:transcription antitermination factor NusG